MAYNCYLLHLVHNHSKMIFNEWEKRRTFISFWTCKRSKVSPYPTTWSHILGVTKYYSFSMCLCSTFFWLSKYFPFYPNNICQCPTLFFHFGWDTKYFNFYLIDNDCVPPFLERETMTVFCHINIGLCATILVETK